MNEEQPHRAPDIQAAHPRTHRTLFFDTILTSPFRTHFLQRTANRTGLSVNTAAQVKVNKYRTAAADPEDFIPMALETC